jgi:hypothetical protein
VAAERAWSLVLSIREAELRVNGGYFIFKRNLPLRAGEDLVSSRFSG